MSIFQRWRFTRQVRTIRADLDRVSQRIDHTEHQLDEISTQVNAMSNALNRLADKHIRGNN